MHVKLKGMEHRAPHKHIFSYTHLPPLGSGQKVKTFLSECGHVALYQIKGKEL